MTTTEVQEGLRAILDEVLAVATGEIDECEMTMPQELEDLIRVESYEDAGIMMTDAGMVLRYKGGEEFQITIVRSR